MAPIVFGDGPFGTIPRQPGRCVTWRTGRWPLMKPQPTPLCLAVQIAKISPFELPASQMKSRLA
jgi:hypothetical protein